MTTEKTPFAITLDPGSSHTNHTGLWRTERPEYRQFTAPCNEACPAGENTRGWLYLAEEGRFRDAWDELTRINPFPAITGRVCYAPCEPACNRDQLDQPVNIHAVERFLGDEALERQWDFHWPEAGPHRVAVVGAGPAGLSAAYHLRLRGHQVTVFDAGEGPGGMMRYGIPRYRLPLEILDDEVARLERGSGIILEQRRISDVAALLAKEGFAAVFLALGAHLSRRIDIPASQAGRTIDALQLLHDADRHDPDTFVGRRIAIYGGGNTAMDAARTVKRLGASEAVVIYRRDMQHMPAEIAEMKDALDEGVHFRWLSTIRHISDEGVQVETMQLDEDGVPRGTGRFETLGADSVVLAVGQDVDSSFLDGVPGIKHRLDGVVEVDGQMMTGYAGIFAGGDMIPRKRSVTVAIGHGRQAALCMDAWLTGRALTEEEAPPVVGFNRLNIWYYADAPRRHQKSLDLARRHTGFEETQKGLDRETAVWESRRCLSCGRCFGCDNCYGVCPDNAVKKLAPGRYEFDYDFCKGCGICARECPSHAIEMVIDKGFGPPAG